MRTVEVTYRYGDPALVRRRPMDADAARLRLDEGDGAFAGLLKTLAADSGTTHCTIEVDGGSRPAARWDSPRQRPFAAVLGCSDARVPVELIFNEGPNDLFVVRVAGNGLGNDILGSLRYAIDHLRDSLQLIVVLGHSGCGAMAAAVDAYLEPAGYLALANSHALRSVLDRELIVVQATAKRLTSAFGANVIRRPRYREALIEASIVTNAALAAYAMQQELHDFDPLQLRAVYGVYLLQSRVVWTPSGTAMAGLAEPPRDPARFLALSNALIECDRIASLVAAD